MVYTVTFNPAIDYVVHTGEMKLGSTNRSDREEMYFGGKGINVSSLQASLVKLSRTDWRKWESKQISFILKTVIPV